MITPAISVLSALEGVNVVTDSAQALSSCRGRWSILLLLFAAQRSAPPRIGAVFGPVMLLWFVVIASLGLIGGILRHPAVLAAIDPRLRLRLHGRPRMAQLRRARRRLPGASPAARRFMPTWAISGAARSALSWYGRRAAGAAAELRRPDRAADGRTRPHTATRSSSSPRPGRSCPLVVLATLATIIASQAIITGAFSLTRQAMQLGWFPGLEHPPDLRRGIRPDLRAGGELGR